MARAFRAAVASPRTPPASSPFRPSKNTGSLANLQWLFRKRGSKQEPAAGYDDDERASMFAGATPYHASATATPYRYGPTAAADDYSATPCRAKRGGEALTRFRAAVLAVLARARRGRRGRRPLGSSSCVTGTIFGRRRGRVHIALQADPRAPPALLLELAAYSTGALVREMASGLVRLVLECERAPPQAPGDGHKAARPRPPPALVEEPTWRAYCNGRKCGYAVRRDCGAEEWRVLRAVEPVSVGAGVIPDDDGGVAGTGTVVGEGGMMYMRAKFESVVGSRDSEAFYMVNPDDGGGRGEPELSIYLLRV